MVKAPRTSELPLWAGLLGPPFIVAVCILALGVNGYLLDEWDAIAAMFLDAAQKGWSLALLWAPHNEHRLPLPRILFAVLHGHGPHLVLGMLLSLAVMGLGFALLHRVLLGPALRGAARQPALFSVLFSALFFSFGQKENLFWNFQLAWSIAICGFVLAALGLQAARTLWFLVGLALCYLCSAHWVALVPLVVFDGAYRIHQALGDKPARATGRNAALWTAAWQAGARLGLLALLFKVYVRGGSAAPLAPFLKYAAQQPLAVAEYFLMLLGNVHAWSGVSATAPLSLVGGALFLALSAMLFLRGSLRPSGENAPAFYLVAGMLALALTICIGRAPLGISQALDSRYQACTLFGWLALLSTLLRTMGQKRWARWLLLGCLINVALASVSALRIAAAFDAPARRQGLDCQQAFLQRAEPLTRPECAGRLYPDVSRQEALTRALHALGHL
jgi:hypothetical protein